MLHDPARHETLQAPPWDAALVRATIAHIVRDTEQRWTPQAWWPSHPRDDEPGDAPGLPRWSLYDGAAGVVWALHHLADVGAAALARRYDTLLDELLARNREALAASMPGDESASFWLGDTPLLMMMQARRPDAARADRLAGLIDGNLDHPARELLWGAPGTMLAALFLHRRHGSAEPRWAALFRRSAQRLWDQLEWSDDDGCHYWSQDLYGRHSTYIDAVHGFAGTAAVLLRGRDLFDAPAWARWQAVIETTVTRTATREGGAASWRPWLVVHPDRPPPMLMQYCHGAPGFVVNLVGIDALDALLLEGGEAVWRAGPLAKGDNLCHGTAGNGYALLKLYERHGDVRWLERARAFAMHAIGQMRADERVHGRLRYSLWTGDLGLAIYLHDCLRGRAAFPTLDVFDAAQR
jgi:Lanthionine synthetase C-like protein